MTPGARLAAAIEVLTEIEAQRRPAADALKAWGLARRFAGSGDRAAIAGIVYDALRRKASAAFLMGGERPRDLVLGMLRLERKLDVEAIARLCDGAGHSPAPLEAPERAALESATRDSAELAARRPGSPATIRNGSTRISPKCSAMSGRRRARRSPAARRSICASMRSRPIASGSRPRSRIWARRRRAGRRSDLRIVLGADTKNPAIHAEPAFIKGLVEVQDEGSQLAALLVDARPGQHVIDLCAGAGGKTLALAAIMQNQGQIYATDSDKRRLAPIHARVARAGARNVQILTPKGVGDALADLEGRADRVLIDAPCTGIGAWRRNPDAKWRMRPGALEIRVQEQAALIERAVGLIKPRRPHRLCHLLALGRGEQRPGARVPGAAPGFHRHAGRRADAAAGRARAGIRARRHDVAGRAADDAAPHRDGWIFRVGPDAARRGFRASARNPM